MPDARPPEVAAAPQDDWGQVLAALPLESPPPGGWDRIAQQMPRRRSPARIWVPAALAASLALLLVAPWKNQPPATPVSTDVVSTPRNIAPATQPPVEVAASPSESAQVGVAAHEVASSDVGIRTPAVSTEPTTAPRRNRDTQPRQLASAPIDATVPAHAASVDKEGAMQERLAAELPQPNKVAAVAPSPPSQEDLYAESARLEALLSQIRDDRVSSATAMALSAELHDRISGIDAALSQPDLDAGQRLGLWRERVATLQRMTGVESTQRWMAANGYRADGQVAQIY